MCIILLCLPYSFVAALFTDRSNLFGIMHEAGNRFVGDIIVQATCLS